MALPPKARTPLRQTDGPFERRGDDRLAARLEEVFTLRPEDEELPVQGLHGIHPYPGRMHPAWASRILDGVPDRARVFDPFCGSGTTMVETMRTGRAAIGTDLNPIAIRIAKQRTTVRPPKFLEKFAAAANEVHEEAAHRKETPYGALAKGEKSFPPHVLTQLINLRRAIDTERNEELRETMLMAMSPLLAKFASRRGRPAPAVNRRAVRDHFLLRCERNVTAWTAFAEALPAGTQSADVRVADARETGLPPGSADAVVTSPPYPGVYDYAEEQQLRARWLGGQGELRHARRHEIGRRGGAPSSWETGIYEALKEIVRVTTQGARIFLVVGDGTVKGKPVRAEKVIRRLIYGRDLHLVRLAAVSAERPWFHADTAEAFGETRRREHLILLERP